MMPPPPSSTLFPYTTLFRSPDSIPTASPIVARGTRARGSLDGARRTAPGRRAAAASSSAGTASGHRSEEHTSELQSHSDLVCRLLLEKKKKRTQNLIYFSRI